MGISMAIPTTEKNRPGPQRLKFPPWLPKLEPLPKRFFSRINSKTPNCSFHVLINRMKRKTWIPASAGMTKYRALTPYSLCKSIIIRVYPIK